MNHSKSQSKINDQLQEEHQSREFELAHVEPGPDHGELESAHGELVESIAGIADLKRSRKDGFMLIEVVLAITLLGIAAVPLLNLQTNLIHQVWREHDHLDRLWILKNLFSMPEIQKFTASGYTQRRYFEQKNAVNFNEMQYECVPINSQSELASHFPDLYVARSSGRWQGLGGEYDERIISFVYIAPVSEKISSELSKKEQKV